MKTLKGYKSCLDRQVNEAVRVTISKADTLSNSKNEFHQTPIIRVVAASGLQGDQGESQEATIASSWRRGSPGQGRDQGSWEYQETERDDMTVNLVVKCVLCGQV